MIERTLKQNETNVAVAPKEPLYMEPFNQLLLMEEYTETHKKYSDNEKLTREIECLKVLFPKVFRPFYCDDLIVGRFDALPIGFGSVTSVGGPGHYCNFSKLDKLLEQLCSEDTHKYLITNGTEELTSRIDALKNYWMHHETREVFYNDNLIEDVLGRFVDVLYPAIVTARFSGMYLNYNLLLDQGIHGLKERINEKRIMNPTANAEYDAMLEGLTLLQEVIEYHSTEVAHHLEHIPLSPRRRAQLQTLYAALNHIKTDAPSSFIEAMQLAWLYSSLAGVVNFGRVDDYLGDFLANDLDKGLLSEEEALEYIQSMWRLIEVKRTNVNGRVIVGGLGRRHMKNADRFCRLAIIATQRAKLVEPQFTLRIYTGMDPAIYELALDCIAAGTTYPILYNDDINIPAVMKMMNVDHETATQYVPFGCGEFVLSGQGIGTPNACINVLKTLDIFLHDGIDQWDYKNKLGECILKKINDITSFEQFFNEYKKLLRYYIQLTGDAHANSYRHMNKKVGFIFTSILTDDCISRGKMVLDGGVKHLGGTNEMYGNINASDALTAIKKLVFDDKKYTLQEIQKATACDFDGYESLQAEMKAVVKFGNDEPYADMIAKELHEYLCYEVSSYAPKIGLDSWLVVVINNQVNTEWGRATASTADGRIAGLYMSNAINPQSGADTNGPTAMLNSLLNLRADIHGGSVQNIKFSKSMFRNERMKIKPLFSSYFKRGGPQLMVTIVNPKELEDAVIHPENHQNLTVRVGGFSARFVNLEADVQQEILARTLNE